MSDPFSSPGGDRSRDRRDRRARGRATEHHDPAHRVGELHVARGARGAGLRAHEQVLGGLPGEAVLRRQLRGRRRRGARPRSRVRAVRDRARQRAAALRRQRQHGRVHGAARSRRQGDGHAPRPGRPPDARLAGQLQRTALRLRRLRRRRRDRDARLRPGPRPRPARAPEDDRRRRDRVPADHRLRRVPRDRRRGRRAVPRRRRPHRRPHRRRRAPVAGAVRRRHHAHDAQDPARPPRRVHPVPRGVRGRDRQGRLPGPPGWSAHARDRGQGGGVPRGRPARVPRVRRRDRAQRAGAGVGPRRRRLPDRVGRDRQPPHARRPPALRRDGQAGPGGAGRSRHHRQQERDPERPREAVRDQRASPRHRRRHHGRDGRARDGRDRDPDRDRAPQDRRRRRGAGDVRDAAARLCSKYTPYPELAGT